ncbi:hypothetical protein H5T53_07250 [Candidatus Bipolaricaulota bacterium]|nr:hypothetical protein [Candidatus Bipolaricaulota bacterium]
MLLIVLIGSGLLALTNGAVGYGLLMLLAAFVVIAVAAAWKASRRPLICPINGQKCGKHCAWYDPREEPHCWRVKHEEDYWDEDDDDEDWEEDEEDWDDDDGEDWEEYKPPRRKRRGRSPKASWPSDAYIDTDRDLDPGRRF